MKYKNELDYAVDKATSFKAFKGLIGVILLSFIINKIHPFEYEGTPLWAFLIPLLYILYMAYKVSEYRAIQAEKEVYDVQTDRQDAEDLLREAVAVKERSDRRLNEANAKLAKAERLTSDMQTLSTERRMLTEQVQTLGEKLKTLKEEKVNAEQSKAYALQKLEQTHRKEATALLTRAELAEKELASYKKAEAKRVEQEERKTLIKSIKATWSASGKDKEKMNEKFGKGNWEQIVKG